MCLQPTGSSKAFGSVHDHALCTMACQQVVSGRADPFPRKEANGRWRLSRYPCADYRASYIDHTASVRRRAMSSVQNLDA
jgi:hypothetical protein